MPNPLFGVTAAARLDLTAGAPSRAAYFNLVAQYQFGTPIIYGRAPAELAATIGVGLLTPIVDPGINASVPSVIVVTFPNAVPSVIVGANSYPVSTAVGGGTIVGANWVDGNGVLHPDVDWQWQISVEGYQNQSVGDLGTFDIEVVTWVGNDAVGRLIPTTFDLTQGVVAVWIFPQGFGQSSFRYRGMIGTAMVQAPVTTTAGIMSFQAGGFTVTDDAPSSIFVNFNTIKFTALVFRDNTTTNLFMQVGTYPGWPAVAGLFTANPGGIMVGGGVTLQNLGQPIPFVGPSSFTGIVTGIIDGTHFTVAGSPSDSNNYTANAVVGARTFAAGLPRALSQVWIFGRASQAAFCSDDFVAPNSVSFGVEAKPLTTQITALAGGNFSIGTDNNVNGNALPYFYVAFSILAGDLPRNLFRTYKVTGNGGVVQVTGLGFTPQFATARPFVAGAPASMWRSPWHVGTDSIEFNLTDIAADGIRAFGPGTIDLGSTVAPAATDVYGFAVVGGSITIAAPPDYVPAVITSVPNGGIAVVAVSAGGGQACKLGAIPAPV